MNRTKKLISFVLSSILVLFNAMPALAVSFSDVSSDYWAAKEINSLAEKKIITAYPDDTFKPDNPVNRAEFTSMVVKTLDKDEIPITISNPFVDISEGFWAYGDILRSSQLGLVVGYPDQTFQPDNKITKSEATSIISKTMKDCEKPCSAGPCPVEEKECTLKRFADKEEIADWAKMSYTKAVKKGLYVNHPDESYLEPNRNLTRAETAVLLYKIRKNPCVVKEEYAGPELMEKPVSEVLAQAPEKLKVEEYSTVVEHLASTPYSGAVNEVEITGKAATVLSQNILPVKFEGGFKSKGTDEGDVVYLVFDKDLTTEEGTTIIPAGSKLVAEVTDIKRGKPLHLNAEATLDIANLVTPSGDVYPLSGTIENEYLLEPEFGACNLKKAGIVAGSVAAFGTLLGLVIGTADDIGDGTALGAILGGSIGAGLGLLWPGCGIDVPADEQVYVKLQDDLDIELD